MSHVATPGVAYTGTSHTWYPTTLRISQCWHKIFFPTPSGWVKPSRSEVEALISSCPAVGRSISIMDIKDDMDIQDVVDI